MAGDPADGPGAPPGRRRRLLRLAVLPLAVLALLAATLLLAPSPIARYILDRYVGALGVVLEGRQTLDVDIAAGRVSFGPARFRLGDADPGQITRMALRVSLPALFERRALLTTLVVDGLDLSLARDGQGRPVLNGVPLAALVAPRPAGEADDGDGGWGAGLDSFQLTGSRVRFALPAGGTAELAIDRLDLEGFRTWEPDDPGTFAFSGALAAMPLTAEGEAWPFADRFNVRLRYGLTGVEWAKLRPLTGDVGLDPVAGRADLTGAGEISHDPEGDVTLALTGDIAVAGLDVGRPGMGRLAFQSAKVRHALRADVAGGGVRLAGSVGIDAAQGDARLADGRSLAVATARLAETAIAFERTAQGAQRLAAEPALALTNLRLAGGPVVAAATANAALAPLTVAVAADGRLTISGSARLDATGLRVAAVPENAVTAYTVDAASASASVADASLDSHAGRFSLGGRVTLTAPAARLALAERGDGAADLRAVLDTVAIAGDRIGIDAGGGRVTVAAAGTVRAAGGRLTLPVGDGRTAPVETRVEAPVVTLAAATVTLGGAETRIEASGVATADRIAAGQAASGLPATGLPAAPPARPPAKAQGRPAAPAAPAVAVTLAAPRLDLAALDLVTGGAGSDAAATLRLTMSGLQAAAAPSTQLAAATGVVSADGLKWTSRPTLQRVAGSVAAALTAVEATWGAGLPGPDGQPTTSRGAARRFGLDGRNLSFEAGSDGRLALAGALTALTRDLVVRSPALATMAGGIVEVGEGEAVLKELVRSRRRAAGWRAMLDSELSQVRAGTEGAVPRFTAEGLHVTGFRLNDVGAISLGDLRLDRGTAAVDTAWLQRLGGDKAAQVVADTVVEVAETAPVRLERLRVENGLAIRFADPGVQPPARFDLDIEALDVGRLDTRRPEQRTDVLLRATLNGYTPIELQGWIAPLGAKPDFAIQARVSQLQLPPLSPYTARAVGLNLESGRLGARADATATAGQLDGVITLDVLNLTVAAAGPAGAARVEQAIGVSPAAAIGLIADDDGRIRLSLPIAGDLTSPSFDFSDAIGQAAGNVVKAAVLAPFRLALLPVTLVAGAVQAGPPKIEPIPFEPGTDRIAGNGRATADALARVLAAESRLTVQVCGRATRADAEALPPDRRTEAALRDLAAARTLAVRRALVDDRGVRPAQVLDCRIEYGAADPGPPVAAIRF